MKLTAFILLFFVFQTMASSLLAQGKFSIEYKNSTVEKILLELENQSNIGFMYNKDLVDVERKVNINVKDASIDKILQKLFPEDNVTFYRVNNQIVISPKFSSIQQEKSLKGKVTDESGEPLPGVTVLIKGTINGTVTNVDGNYSISNIPEGASLQFSFVGMVTQEIVVSSQTTIDITLLTDAIGIEEVVAIGYGTVRRKDLTGSASRADIGMATETSNVSIVQALQGKVAGLNVGAVTSAGAAPSLSVRGISTLSTSGSANAPLIVLDGIIYSGSLVDLNTSDIESVDVLKDVSSSAIYGTQGANGVILITTKGGAKSISKPVINYSASYSIQTPSNKLTPMNADEYEEFYPDIFWSDGGRIAPDYLQVNPDYVWQNNLKTNEITEGYNNGVDSPWWDTFTRNGSINNHSISLSGKSETLKYFVSGGFTDQVGYLENDDYSKYNFRINLDAKVTDWLSVGTQTFAVISDYSGVTAGATTPFVLQPWAPEKDADGEFIPRPEGGWLNPHLAIQQENSDIRTNLFSTMYAEIKLPVKGLAYRMNYSNNYRRSDYSIFNPYDNNFEGSARKTHGIRRDWTFDNIITYKRTFNDDHNVSATLLYGVDETISSSTNATANNFAVDFLGYNRLQAGDPTLNEISSAKSKDNSIYQMARVLYNYKHKYFFTGTVRRDGFSGFGKDNKVAVFPSFGLAWVLSEESFMKNIEGLDFLKIKGSYGQTGRRGIGAYSTIARVSSGPVMVFGDGGSTFLGQSITSLANNSLKWETTTGLNAGLDFEVMNSRLSGNIDYYTNETEDILFGIALPSITGFGSISDNIAKVSNHGIDVSLTGTIVQKGDWNWSAGISYSRTRNKIESIIGADNDGDGIEDDLVANRLFIGEPQTVLYDYEISGMWQLADKDDGSIWQGFLPGTYKLTDISGPDGEPDGKISSLDDKKILGYTDPAYRFGISNTVTYKNFSLYVFINSIQGGKDRYYGNDAPHVGNWNKRDQLGYSNIPSGAWDYWMPENTDAKYRRLDNAGSYGGTPYTQRSFIRLQDVSLSYTVPSRFIDKYNIDNLKLFISGKNLLTLTDWNGWDPETGAGFQPGTPLLSSYTLGLNIQF